MRRGVWRLGFQRVEAEGYTVIIGHSERDETSAGIKTTMSMDELMKKM